MKSKKSLVEYLLENHVDEDGVIDISGLDFGDFKGDFRIDKIKINGSIFQNNHKNKGNVIQRSHENKGTVYQNGHKNLSYIEQGFHKNKGAVYQNNHKNKGEIWQSYHENKGAVIQSFHKNIGNIEQGFHKNNGEILQDKFEETKTENKNEPKNRHYKTKIEPIKFMEENFSKEEYIGFCKGNVIKYISRFDKKGTPVDDLEKAKVYIDYILKNLQED